MSISEKSRKVINELISENVIPKTKKFEVTEELVNLTFEKWNEIYHPGYTKKLKPTAIRYGKKIAGINLMKLNLERTQETITLKKKSAAAEIKCGIVYVITNEAFPGYFKIGMTTDLDSRLKSYQTYDPLKRFKVEHYNFVSDRRKVEKTLLDKFQLDISSGEWITNEEIKKEIYSL